MNAPIDHSNDKDRLRGDASRPRWANDEEWRAAESVPFVPTLSIDEAKEAEHLDRLAAELAASAAAQFAASVTPSRPSEPRQPDGERSSELALQPETRPHSRYEAAKPRHETLPLRRDTQSEARTVLRQETHAEFRSVLRQEARAEFRPEAQDAIPLWMQKPHALQPTAQPSLPPMEQPSPRFRFGHAARAFVLAMGAAGGAYFLVYGVPEPLRGVFGETVAGSTESDPRRQSRTAKAVSGKLVGGDIRGMVGDWIPLNLSVEGQMTEGDAIITGFAPGTTLSMGEAYGSGGWRVAFADISKLQAHLPQAFSGNMDLVVELRRGDATVVDRKAVRLEAINPRLALASMGRAQPAPPQGIGPVSTPTPARSEETVIAALPRNHTNQAADEANVRARQMDPAEAAVMLKRGEELAKTGDLAGARLLLRRAAEANNAGAAFALAATYDPIVLKQLSVLGMNGDVAVARQWYERARDLGIREATARLEALARWGR